MTPEGQGIVDRIFAGVANDSVPVLDWRSHLGASGIGDDCERKIWYSYRWHTERRHSGRLLRLFDRGKREELPLVNDIRKGGVEVLDVNPKTGRQWSFRHPEIPSFGGSMDGICRGWDEGDDWIGLEIKTASSQKFREFQRNGVRATSPTYYGQVQTYMHLSHIAPVPPCPPLNMTLELVVNKDNDELYAEIIEYDPDIGDELSVKAQRIVDADRATDLVRISPTPDFWKCKFCDHKLCHNEEIEVPVNCRTCKHSVQTTHTWRCSIKKKRIPLWLARAGCDKHLPLERFDPESEEG
jgi:hypothetical protein